MASIPEETLGEETHPQEAGGGFERGSELTLSSFGFLPGSVGQDCSFTFPPVKRELLAPSPCQCEKRGCQEAGLCSEFCCLQAPSHGHIFLQRAHRFFCSPNGWLVCCLAILAVTWSLEVETEVLVASVNCCGTFRPSEQYVACLFFLSLFYTCFLVLSHAG